MKLALPAAVAGMFALACVAAQDPAAAKPRLGVLNTREVLDRTRNAWMADIEAEVQRMVDADAGGSTDLNPLDRNRKRGKIQDLANRRRIECYQEMSRIAGEIAKERGYESVHNIDRLPANPNPEFDVLPILEHRHDVWHLPEADLTQEVRERLNKFYAGRRK